MCIRDRQKAFFQEHFFGSLHKMDEKKKGGSKLKAHTPEQTALRVSSVSIVGNILLSGFKLFAGFAARSSALISDAVHSASDVFSTVVVMIGIKVAHRAADKSHPYGHERMECCLLYTSFRAAFEGTNFELLETQYGDGDAAKSKDIAANYITQGCVGIFGANEGSTVGTGTVSYTHLDVYKRQSLTCRSTPGSSPEISPILNAVSLSF